MKFGLLNNFYTISFNLFLLTSSTKYYHFCIKLKLIDYPFEDLVLFLEYNALVPVFGSTPISLVSNRHANAPWTQT